MIELVKIRATVHVISATDQVAIDFIENVS